MNRKLRNTFAGITVSAALLVLGLVVAQPRPAQSGPMAGAQAASVRHASSGDMDPAAIARLRGLAVQAAEAQALADDASDLGARIAAALEAPSADGVAPSATAEPTDDSAARPAKRRARATRQTLVMPYFSFAPRG